MYSILRIFGAIVAFLFLRFVVRAIYRVYFHPLSKFPGPKLYAATRIPHIIDQSTGRRLDALRDLHRKYGPIVRIQHDELSFTEPNAWKDIYGHGTKGTAGSPPPKALNRYASPANGVPSMIVAPNKDHARQRKIFTPAFSDRALKQQEPLFFKYMDKLVQLLKKGIDEDPEKKVDLVRMYNFTTFDVMGRLTFGESLHMLDKSEYDPWVTAIFAGVKLGTSLQLVALYPLLWRFWKRFVPASINQKRVDHFNHSITRVTKRLEKGEETEDIDLWKYVLTQKEGRGLDRGEMDSHASLFMIAGTETTATLVSGLTYYLLTSPDCMRKVCEEVRGAFDTEADMNMEKIAALPYLSACIKEALRLYPPVPIALHRRTPENGSTVVDNFIPPGTTVSIAQHVMYTDPQYFKKATEFVPERWLGDPEFENDQRQCVQPFSVGPRDCLGKNMAYHEMRLLMAKVLYNFDIELCPESNNWTEQATYVVWEKKPLICKLKRAN
ncbi:cytochrome p450 [Pyrenophora seminiperda CCB06]|uniref:Cytochrome p450 n=1 Tax=Pyrenophora seminiperda CCB06 TaxID=1302712 RepID=A0A3M7MB20_9PLEO|nr:cytochrome p450 [Pyrenophora seminiperda CCB06]